MNRFKIRKLLIINWRGLFYQEIDMDSTITSLTGQNGAGKTTVMAATYVALLPDQMLLDFRNQAGSGVSSKKQGLYGRFGAGHVSYSVLELIGHNSERIIAGVQIRKKTEPEFELIPFAITGLNSQIELDQIFLQQEDGQDIIIDSGSPQGMLELEEQAKLLGAKIRTFRGRIGEYMSLLYELGMTPLRLARSAERKKFNKLLQTSLFGGLSGEIQQSLKEYLLDKDTTLSSQISRAEQNLSTCKQTRDTIERTEQSRKSIEDLYRSSQEMALHAWRGSLTKHNLSQKDTLDARRAWNAEAVRAKSIQVLLASKKSTLDLKETQHQDLLARVDLSRLDVENRKESQRISAQIAKNLSELDRYTLEKSHAIESLDQLQSKISALETLEQKIDASLNSIVKQLFDSTEALSHEARLEGFYKAALAAQNEFLEHFPEVSFSDLNELKAKLEIRSRELLEQSWNLKEEKERTSRLNARHSHALNLSKRLYLLDPSLFSAPLEEAGKTSSVVAQALDKWFDLESETAATESLKQTRDLLRAKIYKLKEVQSLLKPYDIFNSEEFRDSFEKTEELNAIRRRNVKDSEGEEQKLSDSLKALMAKRSSVFSEIKPWDKAQSAALEMGQLFSLKITSTSNLQAIQDEISKRRDVLYDSKHRLHYERKNLLESISQLQNSKTYSDEKLIKVAQEVGGDLLFDVFDALDIETARKKEAEIGPLKNAIHLEDPDSAVESVLGIENLPEEVWLVNHHDLKHNLKTNHYDDRVVTYWGPSIRIAKHPKHPLLGADSREKEIDRIQLKLSKMSLEISELEIELQGLSDKERLLGIIEQNLEMLDQKNPREVLSALDVETAALDAQVKRKSTELWEAREELAEGELKLEALERASPSIHLLDEANLADELVVLDQKIFELTHLKSKLTESQSLVHRIKDVLGDLDEQESPLIVADNESLEAERQSISKSIRVIESYLELRQYLEFVPSESGSQSSGLQERLRKSKDELENERKEIRTQLNPLLDDKQRLKALHDTSAIMISRYSEELKNLTDLSHSATQGSLEESEDRYTQLRKELSLFENEFSDLKVEARGLEVDLRVCLAQTEKLRGNYRTLLQDYRARNHDHSFQVKKLLASHRCFNSFASKSVELQHLDLVELSAITGKAMADLKRSLTEQKTYHRKDVNSLVEALQNVMSRPSHDSIVEILSLYRDIHVYLEQILPRDIVVSDDPLAALTELENQITRLTSRLKHHEQDFATSSYDVAHGIESRIRKEFRNISRLNDGLDKVTFGAIRAVRIKYQKKQGMDALLGAMLNQNNLQLFERQDALSFEQALSKLYHQEMGRAFTGDSLLDFRHYIDLQIQIRRVGNEHWESADSNRLSTGESIGVGLAILIMVLQSWELHTSRLTGRKRESLRFLFLDEASRLDSSSINTLSSLCRDMELQLMIAAPSADDSIPGTTYSLTRQVDPIMGEQVIVRGLRGFGNKVEAKEPAKMAVAVPIWSTLDGSETPELF